MMHVRHWAIGFWTQRAFSSRWTHHVVNNQPRWHSSENFPSPVDRFPPPIYVAAGHSLQTSSRCLIVARREEWWWDRRRSLFASLPDKKRLWFAGWSGKTFLDLISSQYRCVPIFGRCFCRIGIQVRSDCLFLSFLWSTHSKRRLRSMEIEKKDPLLSFLFLWALLRCQCTGTLHSRGSTGYAHGHDESFSAGEALEVVALKVNFFFRWSRCLPLRQSYNTQTIRRSLKTKRRLLWQNVKYFGACTSQTWLVNLKDDGAGYRFASAVTHCPDERNTYI